MGKLVNNVGDPPNKKVVGNSLVFSNPNDPEYKYRNKMYQDSLNYYNFGNNVYNNALQNHKNNAREGETVYKDTYPIRKNIYSNKGIMFNKDYPIMGNIPPIKNEYIDNLKSLYATKVNYPNNMKPDKGVVLYEKKRKAIPQNGNYVPLISTNGFDYMVEENKPVSIIPQWKKPVTPIKLEIPEKETKFKKTIEEIEPKVPVKKPPVPEKPSYDEWYKTVPEDKNSTSDYDLQKAYENLPYEQMKAFSETSAHLPDTYKKPSHPTFSNGSIYSSDSTPGGIWSGDDNNGWTYQPTQYVVDQHGGVDAYQKWFTTTEPNSKLDLSKVSKPIEYVDNAYTWMNNTTPMLQMPDGTNKPLDINSSYLSEFYKLAENKLVTDKITKEQYELLLKSTK